MPMYLRNIHYLPSNFLFGAYFLRLISKLFFISDISTYTLILRKFCTSHKSPRWTQGLNLVGLMNIRVLEIAQCAWNVTGNRGCSRRWSPSQVGFSFLEPLCIPCPSSCIVYQKFNGPRKTNNLRKKKHEHVKKNAEIRTWGELKCLLSMQPACYKAHSRRVERVVSNVWHVDLLLGKRIPQGNCKTDSFLL